MMFALLWQSGRYGIVEDEIARLESEQKAYFMQNRRLISQVSMYDSPAKISEVAENRLKLIKDEERDVIRIVLVAE